MYVNFTLKSLEVRTNSKCVIWKEIQQVVSLKNSGIDRVNIQNRNVHRQLLPTSMHLNSIWLVMENRVTSLQ